MKNDLLELLKKALNEPRYGELLINDPERAFRDLKIEPTPERLQAVRDLEAVIRSAVRPFGGEFMDEI